MSYYYKDRVLSTSGRWDMWVLQMKAWSTNFNLFTGSGFGSYAFFGPITQRLFQKPPINIFPNLHSDVLQTLYEVGFIGIVLAFTAAVTTFRKAFQQPWLFASLSVYFLSSFINMPSRYLPIAILGFLLIRLTYQEEKYVR